MPRNGARPPVSAGGSLPPRDPGQAAQLLPSTKMGERFLFLWVGPTWATLAPHPARGPLPFVSVELRSVSAPSDVFLVCLTSMGTGFL